MNCKTICKWISLAADDALSKEDEQTLHKHLEKCAVCRAEWETQQKLHRILQSVPQLEAGESILPEIRQRLNEKEARLVWLEDIERFAKRFVPAAAAVLLLLSGFAYQNAMDRLNPEAEMEWLVADAEQQSATTEDLLLELVSDDDKTLSNRELE